MVRKQCHRACSRSLHKLFLLTERPKKDNERLKIDIRPCVDLRKHSSRLSEYEYPLPNICDIIDGIGSIAGSGVRYTTLDLRYGYIRFSIPENHLNWVDFKCKGKLYRFSCAPFSIKPMAEKISRSRTKFSIPWHYFLSILMILSSNHLHYQSISRKSNL